ncbi:CLUMA_CG018346, isoform A [Clunio marinus]|uniref:CLUMA_CG018346, isoform A n=1 Tax=Clunio marinus TaxID=568069 RepID=A0A1J1J124_9DIPT|nr:CLUMA_CG018346, isoform A [Clunio marinus]
MIYTRFKIYDDIYVHRFCRSVKYNGKEETLNCMIPSDNCFMAQLHRRFKSQSDLFHLLLPSIAAFFVSSLYQLDEITELHYLLMHIPQMQMVVTYKNVTLQTT